ncbi:MAG: NnrS family protein [Zoogloeaceae bacterium]|nr:NnrS family protein [Zoogloeaceae bacterium]
MSMNLRPAFFSAPHRVMFFAGALQLLLTMIFWATDLAGRHAGFYVPFEWPYPPMWLHAVLMIYGIFTFFVFGFLMTALPKWVAQGPLEQHQFVPGFILMAVGWGVFYIGFLLPVLIPLGLLLTAAGWVAGWRALFDTVRASMSTHKTHAWVVLAALAMGVLGLLFYAFALLQVETVLVQAATETGLWLFLVPVFFTVTYRMLPFFSGSVVRNYKEYRGTAPFWIVLGVCVVHALAGMLDLQRWLWPADLLGSASVFWLAWRWQIHRVFVSHLLAMHHMAGLWLGTALLLFAVQGAGELFGVLGWGGRAPLHALTVGYFGSILLGMATRVTLGHSGRLISSDVWAWRLFWMFQCVVLLRLAGEWLVIDGVFNLIWLSALGWLLVFGMWNRVHLLMFLKPRPDGRPG